MERQGKKLNMDHRRHAAALKRKIGQNRGKSRLWLQSPALEGSFVPGARYAVALLPETRDMYLRVLADGEEPGEGEEKRARKISGKGDMAIIDMVGAVVDRAFWGASAVLIKPGSGLREIGGHVMHIRGVD